MIAMGIGIMELLILAAIGLVCIGVPVIIVIAVLIANRKQASGAWNEVAQLREENIKLREEIERLKKLNDKQ